MRSAAKRAKIPRKKFFVLAHNMRSLLNLGSVFRSADSFGVNKIFLTGYTGRPDNPVHRAKIAKTALGAEQYVEWEHANSAAGLIRRLKLEYPGLAVVGLENNVVLQDIRAQAANMRKYSPTFPLLLVLGEEVGGIPAPLLKLCDCLVEIPMLGKKESLNVAVAFGIAAYHIARWL